jgi:hypothetical protein
LFSLQAWRNGLSDLDWKLEEDLDTSKETDGWHFILAQKA